MASKPHYKRILVASGVSERKPGRIIRGFERITILLKPLIKSYRLPLELLPTVRKLDRKRLQRHCLAIILVFPVVILSKVQYKAKRSKGNAYFLTSGYAILYKRSVDSAARAGTEAVGRPQRSMVSPDVQTPGKAGIELTFIITGGRIVVASR